MADKYLTLDGSTNSLKEVEGSVTSAGSGNAGEVIALDADGKIDDTLLPESVGAETVVAPSSEALAQNDAVNLFDDAGDLKVRKATAADNTKPAMGYVKAAVNMGANATVYTDGYQPGTALTKGSKYFLSESAGLVTATPPTSSGAIVQAVGVAVSATQIKFDPDEMWIERA